MSKSILFLLFITILLNKTEGKSLFFKHHVIQKDSVSHNYSEKKLGSFITDGKTYFRLFAPNASGVELITFKKVEDEKGKSIKMKASEDGVWQTEIKGEKDGLFYGYRVKQKKYKSSAKVLCIDPYSKAVASYNTYMNPRKSIVVKEEHYDWEGDTNLIKDWRDLIIYEMHVKDMTAHPTSGSSNPGSYQGLIEKNKTGGISYIKSLGVNAVELLPSQESGNIELPYMDSMAGQYNNWNPYERNYWGYMTAAFFAPEAYYSEPHSFKWNVWEGQSGRQIKDFKDMVKAFHKENIAVIMDVVYNHISQYELGNLKEIDRDYYFRMDDKGRFTSESGTGNDLKTENPMVRRLIIESLVQWMKEYHVDGFRFDLAKMLDWVTIEDIIFELRKINPAVIIVGEPWGGGYDPAGFSARGWGSWNDQIRNGIKGENPNNGHGWIFGNWYGNNNPGRIKSYVNGTLDRDSLGLFMKKEHSVNYLESHDGYTLGDFIRIATGEVKADQVISDINKNAALSPHQMKLNKLAALFLFTSQGITMISEGQEFARSKVIPPFEKDRNSGRLDHNSYEKDNETNYINYHHADLNKELVDYYKGLIQLRNNYPQFRRAAYEDVSFMAASHNEFALGYTVNYSEETFIVLFNANPSVKEDFYLPEGDWEVLADKYKAGIEAINTVNGKVTLDETTGMVLKKKK